MLRLYTVYNCTHLFIQFTHSYIFTQYRAWIHRRFMRAEKISFQLKRYLSTHSCVFLIHKHSSCFSRSAASCACVPISLSAEIRLDPAFHWKQLLMHSKLYILLRMQSFFHHWWKDIFSPDVHELHLKFYIPKRYLSSHLFILFMNSSSVLIE
jgi:hypothetical protein